MSNSGCVLLLYQYMTAVRILKSFSVYDMLLHCDVQRGRVYWKEGYKNPQSSASSLSSLQGAKKQTWRQKRRFGETWIWWLRLLSDYNVEKVQVDRLERRGYCGLQWQRAYCPLCSVFHMCAHRIIITWALIIQSKKHSSDSYVSQKSNRPKNVINMHIFTWDSIVDKQ